MKYIPVDKLIAEIERLKEPYHPYFSVFQNGCRQGRNNVLDDILSFISSLQQEQSEVDLEKEIDDYLYSIERWEVEDEPYRNLDKCARHFYELGRNARKEENK